MASGLTISAFLSVETKHNSNIHRRRNTDFHRVFKMIDDNDLGFFANFLGVFIFVLVIAYHYVVADPKYEGN
ncbi:oligosaccaryltransferase [Medicago truncatula]|uniref:Oligosaccaryltransferase n=1 Tax=Medicago truncatula TaxID=3880 RepID=G7KZM4_MEDTR|nr:oligosaccaryltransferase [Medicago truncatula]